MSRKDIVELSKRTIRFVKIPRGDLAPERIREGWVGITATGYFIQSKIVTERLGWNLPPEVPSGMDFYLVPTLHAVKMLEEVSEESDVSRQAFEWWSSRTYENNSGMPFFNRRPLPYLAFCADEVEIVSDEGEVAKFSIKNRDFV